MRTQYILTKFLNNSLSINWNTHAHGCCLKATKSNCIIYGFNLIIETMTIVHSEAPWGQPQEERLAPKDRTHPMRPLSHNNNTTTRLKRGPNPLSGVLILVQIFFFFFVFFNFVFFFFALFFLYYLFLYLFFYLFLYLRLYVVPLGTTTTNHQVPRLQRGPNPLSGILIPRPPGDNHNKPSSPQATERS